MGTKIYNSTLTKELIEGARIQSSTDAVPGELAEKVIPVMEVNPKMLRVCNIVKSTSATNATTATVYTTPTDKDFFLCSVELAVIKDVTSTSTVSGINVTTPEAGVATNILSISGITLTPQSDTTSLAFNTPILLKRGTGVQLTNATNVGNIRSDACITGYTVDNINA